MLSNKKKSQAPATYNKHLAVLSAILDYTILQQEDDSVLEQYIDDNPCKRVRSLKLDNKIVRYLSDEEKPRLLILPMLLMIFISSRVGIE